MSNEPHRLDAHLGMQVVALVMITLLITAVLAYIAYKASLADRQSRALVEEFRVFRVDVEAHHARIESYLRGRDKVWGPHVLAIPIPEPARKD